MKGWLLLGQAGIFELEEQVVVGAWHTEEGYDHMKRELTIIFSDKKRKKKQGGSAREKGEEKTRAALLSV